MRFRGAAIVGSIGAMIACRGGASRHAEAALVDSIPWANELHEGYNRRVAVTFAGRTDTIPYILVAEAPVRVAPTRLIGFAYHDGHVAAAYEYEASTRGTRLIRLPDYLTSFYSAPSFSNDARHVAHLHLSAGSVSAVVRSWPEGRIVWRSHAIEVAPGDPQSIGHTRWRSPDTAEAVISLPSTDGRARSASLLGSVRARAVLRSDTITSDAPGTP